jgi:hypothetical protein
VEWADIEAAFPNMTSLAEAFSDRVDQVWVKNLFFLMEFCESRRHDSFRTATQELLPEDQFALIDGHFDHMQTNRLMLALSVFCSDPDKLKFLMLWDNVDNRTYQRYSLVPVISSQLDSDAENGEITTSEIEQKIKEGIDPRQLTTELVNRILEDFENGRSSNRQSICQGIHFADSGESCWVFIRRRYKENYITEVNRTVFADEAELIIIRFRSKMREIDIKYELKETSDLAAQIPAHLLGGFVEYVAVNETTSGRHIQKLLDVLMANDDKNLKLMEVDNAGIPLAGSPRIILRGDKITGIAEALKLLEANHKLDLLGNLENLNCMKLSYTSPISTGNRTNPSYIVTVYLQQLSSDDRYFISYSTRAPIRDRTAFEDYMLKHYEIRIVPRIDS